MEPRPRRALFAALVLGCLSGTARGESAPGGARDDGDVAMHVVQRTAARRAGRFELALSPLVVQANGTFTQHYGSGAELLFHVRERFAVQLAGVYHWRATEAGFNAELIDKAGLEVPAASASLLRAALHAGVEVAPIYGKFAWWGERLARFSLVASGGLGLGWSEHQLRLSSPGATFGDTGTRLVGALGLGVRVELGTSLALRAGVRDLVHASRIDTVNGCTEAELEAADRRAADEPLPEVGRSCRLAAFQGADASIAYQLVSSHTSDILHTLELYAGLSWMF